MQTEIGIVEAPYYTQSGHFESLARSLTKTIREARAHDVSLFTVGTEGLFQHYLETFEDPAARQHHDCQCCSKFLKYFGGIVTLTQSGNMQSALWNPENFEGIPDVYLNAVRRLQALVESRPVVSQYLWDGPAWGVAEAGGFHHFAAEPGACSFEQDLTASQAMAVRREDRQHLARALFGDMTPELIRRAVAMLESGGLYRSENLLPMGKFLQGVQSDAQDAKGELRNRILWHAVGRAARGWCTPRASAFGALVDEISKGESIETITRTHRARLDPSKYQRPQAPPTAGNIAQAEKILEKMAIERSLHRRLAYIEDIKLFWSPSPLPAPSNGTSGRVFAHLLNPLADSSEVQLTSKPVTMTFAKFARTVLPHAHGLRFLVPHHGNFATFTTAVYPDAPPIIKWDKLEARNPVSWYYYVNGSPANRWGLSAGSYANILGLASSPASWNKSDEPASRDCVFIILEGSRDSSPVSLGLFPETLRTELHSVRATIEAHSKSRAMPEPEKGAVMASGYVIGNGTATIEVMTKEGRATYTIDRME